MTTTPPRPPGGRRRRRADAPIAIRRARPDDAAAMARIMGEPSVLAGLMQMPFPSEEQHRTRIVDYLAPGRSDLALVAEVGGEVVGSAGLHPASPMLRRRHAMVIGISVLPRAQGQGVGSALMQAMCDYADRWAQVLRLELTVYADNAHAIALYRKFGFFVEGRHAGYAMRDGEYVDALSMARLHPSPPAIVAPAAEASERR